MDFHLPARTQYLVVSGSHSYGMATEHSDIDIRGWCVPPREYFLSFHKNFEQHIEKYEPGHFPWPAEIAQWAELINQSTKICPNLSQPIDTTIFGIRKFIGLLVDCNPNIVELLFVNDEDVLLNSKVSDRLRDARKEFLTSKAFYTFTGYAVAQLKRINTHRRWLVNPPKVKPERKDFGLPERTIIPADQRQAAEKLIEKEVRLWLLAEADIDKSIISNIQDSLADLVTRITGRDLNSQVREAAADKLGMSANFIELLQTEKKYHDAKNNWDQYQSWQKNRNPARAELEAKYLYDTKHASHLIRLLLQAEEILTKGTLTLKDKARSEELLAIRRGKYNFDQLIEVSNRYMTQLEKVYKEENEYKLAVPKRPDINKIDALLSDIITYAW